MPNADEQTDRQTAVRCGALHKHCGKLSDHCGALWFELGYMQFPLRAHNIAILTSSLTHPSGSWLARYISRAAFAEVTRCTDYEKPTIDSDVSTKQTDKAVMSMD